MLRREQPRPADLDSRVIDDYRRNVRKLQFFISSPADVCEERALASRVIERLQSEYMGRVALDTVLWEHEPLVATATFQVQLAKPSEADVVICILWSRLGTSLV